MSVTWTPEQRMVIDRRDDNILVSASAGSGKTAVLVRRILAYLTDPEKPCDIDNLLVVTFTRAAAAEMKERIGRAIREALDEDPENAHLQRQSTLIHNAQITTIDGFCSWLVRNYCYRTELEPGFRVGEEGEGAGFSRRGGGRAEASFGGCHGGSAGFRLRLGGSGL